MRQTVHMSLNVEGALRNYPTDKAFIKAFKGAVTDKDGNPVHPLTFRAALWELHSQGVKVIPMGECEGHDPVTGCPGHPVAEDGDTFAVGVEAGEGYGEPIGRIVGNRFIPADQAPQE